MTTASPCPTERNVTRSAPFPVCGIHDSRARQRSDAIRPFPPNPQSTMPAAAINAVAAEAGITIPGSMDHAYIHQRSILPVPSQKAPIIMERVPQIKPVEIAATAAESHNPIRGTAAALIMGARGEE